MYAKVSVFSPTEKHNLFILLMVLLSFLVEVDAPFSQVWNFFKNLENVPEWDPNMKKTEVIKKT
jgi:uncharacterized membrane protein